MFPNVELQPDKELEHFTDADTAAAFLRITRRTLLKKAREGLIPGYPLDQGAKKKDWRFLLSELRDHMLSCEARPPGACKPPRRFDAQVSAR